MKKCLLVSTLLLISTGTIAAPDKPATPSTEVMVAPVNGLHGCENKKLVVSIPTADKVKAVELCHINGLTFSFKYGNIGKPEVDFNFMGLKSGGYIGEGSEKGSKAAVAIKGEYRYTLTIGKNISLLMTEFKVGNKYQKIEMIRFVNKLNQAEWAYLDKFITNADMTKSTDK